MKDGVIVEDTLASSSPLHTGSGAPEASENPPEAPSTEPVDPSSPAST